MADELSPSATPEPPPPGTGEAAAAPPVTAPEALVAEPGAKPVDFRAPAPLSNAAQRQLRLRHDECARALATRLSIYLRLDCRVQLAALEPARCRIWLDRLPNPSHLTLFKLETGNGQGVVQLSPKLGLIMVDRLLGGTGEPEAIDRPLSEVEVSVVDEVIQLFLREWCQQLPVPEPQRMGLVGHETNSRFIQMASPEDPILGLTWEITLRDQTEQVHMGVPFSMLDPLLFQPVMVAEPAAREPAAEVSASPRPVWNSQFDQVRLPVSALCEEFEVSARRIAGLKVGDVLPIDPSFLNRVQIRLAKIPKFVGRLGRQGENRAVELTALIQK